MMEWIFTLIQFPKAPKARRRCLTLRSWIWISIWMVTLARYRISKWTCQTLISQARPEKLQKPRRDLKKNLPKETVKGDKTLLNSLLISMSKLCIFFSFRYLNYVSDVSVLVPDTFFLGSELDDFDLDPNLKKSERSSNKKQDSRKEVLSDRRGPQGSKIDLAEDISTLDGGSERVDPSKIDTSLVILRKVISINDNCPSKSRSENLELPYGPRSPVKVMTKSVEESDQRSHLSEELATEPYAKPATDDLSGQLVGGVDSNGGTLFEGENDGCLQTDFNTDVDEKMSAGDGPNSEDLPLKDSSPVNIDSPDNKNGDGSKSGGDISTQNTEPKLGSDISTENTESAIDDLDLEHNFNTFVSRKTLLNIKSIKDDQNSTSKIPLSAESSESAVDKVTLTNESKSGEFHSKISKRLEEVGSQMCQPSLIGAKSLSSGSNGIDTMHLCPEERVVTNAHDAQIGSKLPDTPVLVDKETKAKHVISGERTSCLMVYQTGPNWFAIHGCLTKKEQKGNLSWEVD